MISNNHIYMNMLFYCDFCDEEVERDLKNIEDVVS